MSCIIGGEDAAFVQYSRSGLTEYGFYVLHHPDQQFPYLYEVVIDGTGGIDSQSILDVKRMLGSWTWSQ